MAAIGITTKAKILGIDGHFNAWLDIPGTQTLSTNVQQLRLSYASGILVENDRSITVDNFRPYEESFALSWWKHWSTDLVAYIAGAVPTINSIDYSQAMHRLRMRRNRYKRAFDASADNLYQVIQNSANSQLSLRYGLLYRILVLEP